MRRITLPSGESIPVLGQGTWGWGEDPGRRGDAFVVSKVMPSHASRSGTIAACERSLKRLGTDRIDLYLLHWQGRYPLEDTVVAFQQLVEEGKIRY